MKIDLPDSSKFSLLAIKTYTNLAEDLPLFYDNGLGILSSLPTDVDEFWVESIGTIQSEEIAESNLILIAFSNKSEVSEDDLNRFLYSHYHGLLFQGVGYTNQGFNLSGDVNDNLLSIRSISKDFVFKRPPKINSDAYTIDKSHIDKSISLSKSILKIFQNDLDLSNSNYRRLRKGFNAFINGIKTHQVRELHTRLPFFVKALDAIFKTDQGSSKNQFVHRCKFIGGDDSAKRNIYEEIYKMRSSAEHLNPITETLNSYPPEKHLELICKRTYQVELLTNHVYQKIFQNKDLLEVYRNDKGISDFWKKQDHELKVIFSNPIDFLERSEKHFIDWADGWY